MTSHGEEVEKVVDLPENDTFLKVGAMTPATGAKAIGLFAFTTGGDLHTRELVVERPTRNSRDIRLSRPVTSSRPPYARTGGGATPDNRGTP